MTLEHAITYVIFVLVAAGTPGPSNVLLTATGANFGIVRGIPELLGITLGMGFMMLVVAAGLGSVLLENATAMTTLKWVGAAFLFWLSWRIATATRAEAAAGEKPVGFFGAAAFLWVNPKAWLVTTSGASTYLPGAGDNLLLAAAWLGGLFFAASFPPCFAWLGFGAVIQRFLGTDRRLRIFNIVMGSLLAASVILILI